MTTPGRQAAEDWLMKTDLHSRGTESARRDFARRTVDRILALVEQPQEEREDAVEQAWRNGWGSALNAIRAARQIVEKSRRLTPSEWEAAGPLDELLGKWVDLIGGLTEDFVTSAMQNPGLTAVSSPEAGAAAIGSSLLAEQPRGEEEVSTVVTWKDGTVDRTDYDASENMKRMEGTPSAPIEWHLERRFVTPWVAEENPNV